MRLDENTMDDIMAEIVRQMITKGIIKKESGIVVDSTHINANTIRKSKRIAKKLSVGTSTAELYEHSKFTQSEDFLERYKVRAKIEPKNSEMKRFHGLDRADGYDLQSVLLQAMFTAIGVNLKRMAAIIG